LYACTTNNETVTECPIGQKEHQGETNFVVVVHNPSSKAFKQLARVRLPGKDYRAQVWSQTKAGFVDVMVDIFEQQHFNNKFEMTKDYMMFVPMALQPNQVSFIKVSK